MTETPETTVVLAHPNTLLRDCLALLLGQNGYRVVSDMSSEQELVETCGELRPDVVIVDWDISDSRMGMIRGLCQSLPDASVVVLTRPDEQGNPWEALAAGASGCLSANLRASDFIRSLEDLFSGNLVVSKEIVHVDKLNIKPPLGGVESSTLSSRENEIVGMLVNGCTNREIAQELIISEHTVKSHLRAALNKLGLRNRQQLAAYATLNVPASDSLLRTRP
ncbi:MAG: response regulator transcription factor [Chloroflexi bacterium]|nr:response regulator transcription factor [Chloroflexota bacterium]